MFGVVCPTAHHKHPFTHDASSQSSRSPSSVIHLVQICEEVGVVKGVHLLSGEVRSVATALKVVEEVQEEVQEVKDEWEDEEVEENRTQRRRDTLIMG